MSNYRFRINNYHAIKEADISLDGVTVLAGPNGSGKSTISKWLYYVVNIATEYDRFLLLEFYHDIRLVLQQFSRVYREMWNVRTETANARNAMRQNIESLENEESLTFDSLPEYAERFLMFVDDFAQQLDAFYKDEQIADYRKKRISNYLEIDASEPLYAQAASSFCEKTRQQVDLMVKHLYANRKTRSMKKFMTFLREQLLEDDELPQGLSLEEDGVEILMEKQIGELMNVEKAIYIDTPMVFETEDFLNNIFWVKLRQLMLSSNDNTGKQPKMILARIADILNGRIKVKEGLFGNKELFYERSDGRLELPLDKIATGMKTFAYLFQLLKNGHLDDKTILMIDEPEVHLHPQWVVVFAKLLILIHKSLGVKIVLASHNPDFVAAMKAISKREGTLDNTHFYLAEETDDEGCFAFRNLGTDIEPIFESFNIALERIRQYGDTDL